MILPPHSTAVLNHLVRSLELENKVTSTCNQLIVFLFCFYVHDLSKSQFSFLETSIQSPQCQKRNIEIKSVLWLNVAMKVTISMIDTAEMKRRYLKIKESTF